MKFTLSWLREHLETDAPLDTITDTLTRIGLELEGVDRPRRAPAALRRGQGHLRRAAPECRPPARVHGRCRWPAGAGGLRRPQCADWHEGGVRPARQPHPRARDGAEGGRNPRRPIRRHAAQPARNGARRRPFRHRRSARRRPGRHALPGLCRPRRPGHRNQRHAPTAATPSACAASRGTSPPPGWAGCVPGHRPPCRACSRARSHGRSARPPAPGCWGAPFAACATAPARPGCSAA